MSADASPTEFLTAGHGRLEREALGDLFASAGVAAIVDVRRFPGSRRNPAAASGEIERLAGERGIAYRHDPRLGGRRSLTAEEDAASPDTWWQVPAFRAYAGWTRSPEFAEALDDLVDESATRRTLILCSESVWWRCHRRIIADHLLAHHADVRHILGKGHVDVAQLSAGAVTTEDGDVTYPSMLRTAAAL